MFQEKFQRYTKYLLAYCRHMTLKKLINSVKAESRFQRNDPDIDGLFPYVLTVEISNACNLKCPLCQKGLREDVKRTNIITADQYKGLIAPITQYLYQIFLYNWGEPFLNPDIYEIIAFNSCNNFSSVVSTNFTLPVDAQRLVYSVTRDDTKAPQHAKCTA